MTWEEGRKFGDPTVFHVLHQDYGDRKGCPAWVGHFPSRLLAQQFRQRLINHHGWTGTFIITEEVSFRAIEPRKVPPKGLPGFDSDPRIGGDNPYAPS